MKFRDHLLFIFIANIFSILFLYFKGFRFHTTFEMLFILPNSLIFYIGIILFLFLTSRINYIWEFKRTKSDTKSLITKRKNVKSGK